MSPRLAVPGNPASMGNCDDAMAGNNESSALRLCLLGAAPDTGNMGVSALCHATVSALATAQPNAQLTIFDHGRGLRTGAIPSPAGAFPVTFCGASYSRRLYRSDTLGNATLRSWLGGLGSPILRAIQRADAVLDLSGGDSFTDLYGPRRFAAVTLQKRLVLSQNKPLVLLPQTYGPFQRASNRRRAQGILRQAGMAWARDEDSYAALRELLGSHFDPTRHCQGVDMAFGLLPLEPASGLTKPLPSWLEGGDDVVGINVSGLVYNHPEVADRRFGLRASYRDLIHQLLERLMAETAARVLLVPHVLVARGHAESDLDACHAALAQFAQRHPDRIAVLEGDLDASSIKWVIGQLTWFCGTRMHSGIAALSQGIPAAAIAYSPKTRGVFASCGLGDSVADPRHLETREALACLWRAWESRESHRGTLAAWLPRIRDQQKAQIDAVLSYCRRTAS